MAARTIDMFEKNPEKAFIQLVKFFVDLAGFQHVEVDDTFKGDIFEELIKITKKKNVNCVKVSYYTLYVLYFFSFL